MASNYTNEELNNIAKLLGLHSRRIMEIESINNNFFIDDFIANILGMTPEEFSTKRADQGNPPVDWFVYGVNFINNFNDDLKQQLRLNTNNIKYNPDGTYDTSTLPIWIIHNFTFENITYPLTQQQIKEQIEIYKRNPDNLRELQDKQKIIINNIKDFANSQQS